MKKRSKSTIGSGPLNQARQLLVDLETGKVFPSKVFSTSENIRQMVANASEPFSALDFYGNDAAAAERRIKKAIFDRPILNLLTSISLIHTNEKPNLQVEFYAANFAFDLKTNRGDKYSSPVAKQFSQQLGRRNTLAKGLAIPAMISIGLGLPAVPKWLCLDRS